MIQYIEGLPQELVVEICNECLSLCSDESLSVQSNFEFPDTLFLPFLHKVTLLIDSIECSNILGSTLKVSYDQVIFSKVMTLLKNGHKIEILELKSYFHCEFDGTKLLVKLAQRIKLDLLPYHYVYFFGEHSESVYKIHELDVNDMEVLEVIMMLKEEGFRFPNLRRINIKASGPQASIFIPGLLDSLKKDLFGSSNKVIVNHSLEIASISDILMHAKFKTSIDSALNEKLAYKIKISLLINNLDLMMALNDSYYIDLSRVYKLTIGTLSKTACRLIEEQIKFMNNLEEITTHSQVDLEHYVVKGLLRRLKTFKNFSVKLCFPLNNTTSQNLPHLKRLALQLNQPKPEKPLIVPSSVTTLQITNTTNKNTAYFSCFDFSYSNLKDIYVVVTAKHDLVQFKSVSSPLSHFDLWNSNDGSKVVKRRRKNSHRPLNCIKQSLAGKFF